MNREKVEMVNVDPRDGYEQHVVEYRPTTRETVVLRVTQLIYLVGSVIGILLLLRIVFRLLGANLTVGFGAFLYQITNVLVAPFASLLQVAKPEGVVFDLPALVALILYAIATGLLVWLIRALFGGTGSIRSVSRVQHID